MHETGFNTSLLSNVCSCGKGRALDVFPLSLKPNCRTASKPWLLLRHKNYIVVSSATKAALPCELSPSLSPFASCAFSVLAFVFRFPVNIVGVFLSLSPCKQCWDDAGYPRFGAGCDELRSVPLRISSCVQLRFRGYDYRHRHQQQQLTVQPLSELCARHWDLFIC